MRLFVAVRLPPEVRTALETRVGQVRDGYPDLRWVAPDRWHLTLVFLGEVADDSLARVEHRYARRLEGVTALTLQIIGAGRFGHTVLWVGVHGETDRLRSLVRGLDPGGRPYRPHLTVARARDHGADLRPAVEALRGFSGPVWTAGSVQLIRSTLGPAPRYDDVASWELEPG